MTVINLSSTLPLGVGSGLGQRRFDMSGSSEATGSEQGRLLGPPRWSLQLVQPPNMTLRDAGRWQGMLMKLRGKVNRLAAFDPVRVAPAGTLRGSPTLASGISIGATSLAISGSTGTLLAGDLLQIGTGLGTSQLVMVVDDCTHAAVTFEPPARMAFSSAVVITWDRPLAYFRLAGEASTWAYGPAGRVVTGMSLDMIEAWS